MFQLRAELFWHHFHKFVIPGSDPESRNNISSLKSKPPRGTDNFLLKISWTPASRGPSPLVGHRELRQAAYFLESDRRLLYTACDVIKMVTKIRMITIPEVQFNSITLR